MHVENTISVSQTLDRDRRKPHDSATVVIVSVASGAVLSDGSSTPHNAMPMDETDVRGDVERMLDLYVRLEYFSVGSAAGRIAIHESRITRPRRGADHPAEPRDQQERDDRRIEGIRRAIYAPPQVAPQRSTRPNGDGFHGVIPRVVAARHVASIVKGKSGRAASSVPTDRRLLLWKSTIAAKIARIARSCACRGLDRRRLCDHVPALINAARLRVEIQLAQNIVRFTDTELRSASRRKKLGREGIKRAEVERAAARQRHRDLVLARMKVMRKKLDDHDVTIYEEALELLEVAVSESAATRAYCLFLKA